MEFCRGSRSVAAGQADFVMRVAIFPIGVQSGIRAAGDRGAEAQLVQTGRTAVLFVPFGRALARGGNRHDRSRLWTLFQCRRGIRGWPRSQKSSRKECRLESGRLAVGSEVIAHGPGAMKQ